MGIPLPFLLLLLTRAALLRGPSACPDSGLPPYLQVRPNPWSADVQEDPRRLRQPPYDEQIAILHSGGDREYEKWGLAEYDPPLSETP